MAIEWRAIPGWEGLYEVSNDGRVRSLPKTQVRNNRGVRQVVHWKGRELSPSPRNGYPFVGLKDRRSESVYIHRLVCEAFHGPNPGNCEVAHIDGSRTNNHADNLRWATRLENVRDKAIHHTQPQGETVYNARLTDAVVIAIRRSSDSNKSIAAQVGVDPSVISRIRNFKAWRHVQEIAA